MSNLKVYDAGRKKGKYKIVKIAIAATSAVILLVAGTISYYIYDNISNYNEYKKNYNSVHTTSPTTTTNTNNPLATIAPSSTPENNFEIDYLHNPTLDFTTMDLKDFPSKISQDNYKTFEEFIRGIKVKYPYEELYGIDEALNKYNQVVFDVTYNENPFTNVDEISPTQLLEVVLKNNENYKNDQKNKIGGNFYDDLKSNKLLETCKIICQVVNDYSRESKIDRQKVRSYLSTLKIFASPITSIASGTLDNCLIINPNSVGTLSWVAGVSKEDASYKLIVHEIDHMCQKSSPEMEKANTYYFNAGIAYSWKDLKINPLMFDWFVEASAEKNEANYTDGNVILYQQLVGYLESLSLSTILNDNVQVNQTENLTFSNKLDKLFEQFDCKTEEDKKEIIKMMYSTDIMQVERSKVDSDDFFNLYKEVYGKKFTPEEVDDLSNTIKGSVCLTLTKQFYLNLAKQVVNKNVSLQDIFYLITVFENDINSHIKYTKSERFQYNEKFLGEYVTIQDKFFETLSRSNNYSAEELVNLYNDYGIILKIGNVKYQNYSLDWMNSSKKDYISERESYLSKLGVSNIRTSNEEMLRMVYGSNKTR